MYFVDNYYMMFARILVVAVDSQMLKLLNIVVDTLTVFVADDDDAAAVVDDIAVAAADDDIVDDIVTMMRNCLNYHHYYHHNVMNEMNLDMSYLIVDLYHFYYFYFHYYNMVNYLSFCYCHYYFDYFYFDLLFLTHYRMLMNQLLVLVHHSLVRALPQMPLMFENCYLYPDRLMNQYHQLVDPLVIVNL